ncbi:hypothetical protein TNCV_4418951 [Trichonephila clavipes]|nr:hypothetical protein TNCV_4418951 [Trichonephila clavipes]
MFPKELHQLNYEALSIPQGLVRLVKKIQERKKFNMLFVDHQSYHEFEPSTTKDPLCMGNVHVKSVESSNILLWSGVVVKRGQLKYRPRQPWFKITRSVSKSPRVAEQCDVNIHSLNHESSLKLQLLEQNITALPANNISIILVKRISDLRPLIRSCTFE